MPNVTTRPANAPRARHHARIVGVGDEHVAGARLLQDLGLGVGDRVRGCEEPEVRVADVGPHADVRLGDADQRPDFAGMIHAELDHRDLRPRPQLQERERQADVVVQIPLVPEHPVTRRQELRRDFLRRGLARAAGDRDDRRARPPADVAREVLQRARRVLHLDEHGAGRRSLPAAGGGRRLVDQRPDAPRAPARRRRTDGRRSARRGWRRRNRPAPTVRESIETRPIACRGVAAR